MNAAEVMEALEKRYPADKNLLVKEAPSDHMRMGRKIDLLVINVWKSRGFERHAIEIKVSMSDFRSELAKPEKADWWVRHCHRFSIACPAEIAAKVQPELPPNWGLIVIGSDGKAKERVGAPPNPNPEALPMETWIGVCRAQVNAGPFVIERARQEGYEKGKKETLEAMGVDMTPQEAQRLRSEARAATERHDALQKTVRTFERLTGTDLGSHAWRVGISDEVLEARAQIFRTLQQFMTSDTNEMLAHVQRMRTHHTRVGERLASVERILTPPPETASPDTESDPPESYTIPG